MIQSDFTCKVDNSVHKTLADFNIHLRSLRWTQAKYYQTYEPRKDLLTGEPLPFSDYFSYWKTDFLNKNNLKQYCEKNPVAGRAWSVEFLKRRKAEKGLSSALSHVELRTLHCPSVHYFEKTGGYKEICEQVGLPVRYDYSQRLSFESLPDDCVIYQDSREQKPLPLIRSEIKALNFGDYALEKRYCKGLFIERKSLSDFVGSVGKDFERFRREIERAKKAGANIVVLVEEDFNKCQSFDRDWKLKKYVKITPSKIFKNVRDLLHEFDNLQFLFAKGRPEATRLVVKLFEMRNDVGSVDLQYYYEKKVL